MLRDMISELKKKVIEILGRPGFDKKSKYIRISEGGSNILPLLKENNRNMTKEKISDM